MLQCLHLHGYVTQQDFLNCLTLKTEAPLPFEMWVTTDRSRRPHTIKHFILHQHLFENRNSHFSHKKTDSNTVTKSFLCITHTVEHNYISPCSTVGTQLHVSALYVGHHQVVI